jgi:hypothetical protein
MDNEFMKAEFVTKAILAYMREGKNFPDADAAEFIDSMQLIDNLRNEIYMKYESKKDSIKWVLDILNDDKNGKRVGLASSMLKKVAKEDEDIMKCFEIRWKKEDKNERGDRYLQNRLMWRILDKDNLEPEWNRHFLDFIFNNWKVFDDFNKHFYGTGKEAENRLLNRIVDTGIPESKKWIYLCTVPRFFNNRIQAKALISIGYTMDSSFVRNATKKLLDKSFSNGFISEDNINDNPGTVSSINRDDIPDYIIRAVMAYIREGNRPDETSADYLNRVPIIDALRKEITKDDLNEWLRETIKMVEGEVAGFYLSLLKIYSTSEDAIISREINEFLCKQWEDANPFLKAHLMWRILDYDKLSQEWHRKIFKFVFENWDTFKSVSAKFLGTPQTIVNEALNRLGDFSYPESKKWATLCRVPEVTDNEDAAHSLVKLGLLMKDEFTREVAGALLERFYSEQK